MNVQERSAFRRTKQWLDFRKKMYDKYEGKDAITGEKLRKGWNLHHMDLNKDNYTDLSNEDNFLPLNKGTHDKLHAIYIFSKKEIRMQKLLECAAKMREINK